MKWNYAGVAAKVLAQLVVGIVLARLLGPGPFGVYAVVLLVTGIGALLVERGFGSVLIQISDLNDEIVRYCFTWVLLTGGLTALVLSVAAHPLAALFGYPSLTTAIYGSSIYLFVYALGVVPGALLRRNLDMKSYQLAQIVSYLVGYVAVGIGGALAGMGTWSLIGALVTQSIIYVLIAYALVLHAIRPLLKIKGKGLASYGNLAVTTNLLNWLIENLDNLVVGHLYGMHALGLYAVCYNLVRTPTDHVMSSAQAILFAAGARAQENLLGLRKAYLTVVSAVLLLLCPLFLGIASVTPTVVHGIYGGKWSGAQTLLLPLALAMPVHALMTGSGLLWAKGQGSAECKVESLTLAIFLVGLFVASHISLQAIAWTVLAVYSLRAFWLVSRILGSIQLSWNAFLTATRGGLFLGMITAALLYFLDMGFASAGISSPNRLWMLVGSGFVLLTVLPISIRGLTGSAELRIFLKDAIPESPGLLRSVMQMYMRA